MTAAQIDVPVSVIIVTRNEEHMLPRCLAALAGFPDIRIVDSGSTDKTLEIARSFDVTVHPFDWNGRYPKKRQWSLDTLDLPHDWVLMIDADEIMTPLLAAEIQALFQSGAPIASGYFIRGLYAFDHRIHEFGPVNNKLCLFDRRCFVYPEVDDLDIPGMGEIEGHYQPVPTPDSAHNRAFKIGQLGSPLYHYAVQDWQDWHDKHQRYASWEAAMTAKRLWPDDPVGWRQGLKSIWRRLPLRAEITFVRDYILKAGFLEGRSGWRLCVARYGYYKTIAAYMKRSGS